MNVIRSKLFQGENAWDAMDLTVMNGISCRLHWTDQPYRWHINEGEEIFAVMTGKVIMHIKSDEIEESVILEAGDIFHAQVGDEHYAEPLGEARILVIEKAGSI